MRHETASPAMKERFESKYEPDPNTGCWLWMAGVRRDGYGQFRVGGKVASAHRFAYELYVGEIPDGLYVLHRCDTPPCVNPDHLFLGSSADNVADMCAKGKQANGESNGSAKLTEDEVRAILAAEGFSQRELAAVFGVSQSQISSIRRRELWSHVQ